MKRWMFLVALALAGGCDGRTMVDAGPDAAGGQGDASTSADGGRDGGTDAGTHVDASMPMTDGGTDGGSPMDDGGADGGLPDGGADGGLADGGFMDDGGVDGGASCGDGVMNGSDECDGTDLGAATCGSLGFDGGSLACASDCTLDTSACFACGDGLVDGSEQCDGTDLGAATCTSQGFSGGTLTCASDCTFDTGACTSASCGDGVLNGSEQCDGTDLGAATCGSEGFDGGSLACASDCTLDTSACTSCGDGVINGSEQCDGSDLGSATCGSQGFDGGTLGCTSSCALDTRMCFGCGDGVLNGSEQCDGTDFGGATCASGGFDGGVLVCSATCTIDMSMCTTCGNGTAEGMEQCDGTDLRGATCGDRGYASGPLTCSGTCTYDESACSAAASPAAAGDLVISEIMQNPNAQVDSTGEWFEIYNPGASDLNLYGCAFVGSSSTETFTVDSSVVVTAGGYATFAASGTPGFTPSYVWSSFSLSNSSDTITLDCGGVTVDTVTWDNGATFPDPTGASMTLSPTLLNATDNDVGANWCEATSDYDGDLGTPGGANDSCASYTVGFCRLQYPPMITQTEGSTTPTVYGRVYAAGLTDLTTGDNLSPRLHAEVGFGPDGSDPSTDGSWSWAAAGPNPGYTGSGSEMNNDEYQATFTVPPAGTYDYAYRFSGDGGATWVYCDTGNGSSDGYAAADAGNLVSTPAVVPSCHVVVNEVESAGSGGATDEFVELYNPCTADAVLGGGGLYYRSSSGTSDVTLATFPAGTILAAGGYMLFVGSSYSGGGTPDGTMSSGLAGGGGGVGVRDGAGLLLDSMGYGSATNVFVETAAAPGPGSAESVARIPNGTDTDDNSADFAVQSTPTPGAAN